MSALLLESNLREAEPDSEVRTLARARTLTVLERLDPSRRADVMRFLIEADLIHLRGADLSDLEKGETRKIVAPTVTPRGGFGESSTWGYTDLTDAELAGADLRDADLTGALLSGASLYHADLTNAKVTLEQLRDTSSLESATMPNGQKYEDWLKNKDRGQDGESSGPS
jgi:hypothetical protein